MKRLTKKLSFVVALSLIVATGAASAAAALPGLPSEATAPAKVKPKELVYTGDGSGLFAGAKKLSHSFGSLKWSSWTTTAATGSGANWLNNCKPSCAGGKYTAYPVKLAASRPKVIAGKDVFTRLTVTYTGKKPGFVHQKTQTWKLTHTGNAFFWNFPS
jgi:hypothetical protein